MSNKSPRHVPVLLQEVTDWLNPQPGQRIVDGTLGAGGHAKALAERVAPTGLVVALDRDPAAVLAARTTLSDLPVTLVSGNFADLPEKLRELGFDQVDGVLLDLGLSSDQLADQERGFSFDSQGSLDLRFDPSSGQSAADVVNRLRADQLADLIYAFGEERFSRRIARKIVERRQQRPFQTAADLAQVVRACIPRPSRGTHLDSATRTFQALRIAVNEELSALETVLHVLPECLRPGGRAAIISFHSLEDRRVKQAFRDDPRYEVLTRKPIRPGDAELALNPRSRSAKLRVAACRATSDTSKHP